MSEYLETNGVPANGVLGGLSVAEQTQDYILLVKEVTSTTPEIINQTQYAIEWIVGSDGEARRPNQDIETNLDIIQNFPVGKNVISQLNNATSANTQLSGELNVTGIGTIRNILYSQTGIPSSSFDTGSVVFIGVGGAPAASTTIIPNILGSMISSSAFVITSGNSEIPTGYTVTLDTFNADSNFNGPLGVYYLSASDVGNMNSISMGASVTVINIYGIGIPVKVEILNDIGGNKNVVSSNTVTIAPQGSTTVLTSATLLSSNITDNDYGVRISNLGIEPVIISQTRFSVTNTDPSPTANIPAGNFWATGSGGSGFWLTASAYLSLNYENNLQDTSNFGEATKTFGLDPINTTFTLQKGDKIRFEYVPSNTFTIYDVITPSEAADGLLKLKINRQIPNNVVLNNFVLYRIDTNDPKYIILNANKTSVIGDPENPLKGYIFPKYQTKELKANLKNIQRSISQQGLI